MRSLFFSTFLIVLRLIRFSGICEKHQQVTSGRENGTEIALEETEYCTAHAAGTHADMQVRFCVARGHHATSEARLQLPEWGFSTGYVGPV